MLNEVASWPNERTKPRGVFFAKESKREREREREENAQETTRKARKDLRVKSV